ncbi:MAG: septum formation inhibitor Maf [Gammaproteobacteria bacterium]|nr:septum formation inhibitor Maf [Gammaproteobacteria bacterium]
MPTLVLASTSPYRRMLLDRLRIPYVCATPTTDETALTGENAGDLVIRLAEAKARSVAAEFPDALIIGCDQAAELDGDIIGKSGGYAGASAQLARASGRAVTFHTGLCVYDAAHDTMHTVAVPFTVQFRHLTAEAIDTYLKLEAPYDCAGSFKVEALGITLFNSMAGDDPTSLTGLPLIALTTLLGEAGYDVLAHAR